MDKNTIKNTKTTIKNIIKKYGYTMIEKSFYMGDDETSCIFNVYDENGECSHIFIYFVINTATIQHLSFLMIHEKRDISYMFENVEWGF